MPLAQVYKTFCMFYLYLFIYQFCMVMHSNTIPMKMGLNCKNAREFRNTLKSGPLIILNINLAY
jgi:hypothetical protein